jgi:pseudaminic acid cytidylyltransferase
LNNLAIIPARGGSKRIPRKNIKPFLGKPIIAYSIETARQSQLFQEVMVSTDDEQIAEVARSCGAQVPFLRSAENADDHATTMQVIEEVVEAYARRGQRFDYICCIYPTAPLMQAKHLRQGFEELIRHDAKAVLPAAAFSYPIWRGLIQTADGKAQMIFPEHAASRSQDLPQAYHDAGQWYWLKPEALGRPLFDDARFILLAASEVQDIDTLEDWAMAELKYQYLQRASV